MESENAQDPREERANALYWESDDSVNQIADEMEVSKGALYAMVRPLPSGLSCPDCREEMEYPNRTARDRGFLSCPACGLEEEEDAVRELWQAVALQGPAGAEAGAGPVGGGAWAVDAGPRPPRGRPGPERVAVGTALLAAAAGFVLGRLTKRS